MRRAGPGIVHAAVFSGLLLLSACVQAPAAASAPPTTAPASATAAVAPAPSPTSAPSATVEATPTAAATPTPGASATATANGTGTPSQANGVTIEIVGQSPRHTIIQPGQSAAVPIGNGEIGILVHYPTSIWRSEGGSSRPYPISVTVEPSDWKATVGNWANNQTLTLHLYGRTGGQHTITIDVAGGNVKTVSFALDLEERPGTPSAAASTPTSAPRVTLADDGKTLDLQVGQTFLLALGEGYTWTVRVADPSVVSREVNVLVVRGAQGIYRANHSGRTTLTATGDPACRTAQPPCGLPSRVFHVDVVVH